MNEKKITLEVTLEEALYIQIATSLMGGGKEILSNMANSPESSLACVILSHIVNNLDTDKLQGKIKMAIQSIDATLN